MLALQITLYFLIPFLVKRYEKTALVSFLSPAPACYIIGVLLVQMPFLKLQEGLSKDLLDISVSIAMPLLLFSTNFLKWLQSSRKTIIAFLLLIVSVGLGTVFAKFLFLGRIEAYWEPIGMLAALFTGGTPNMAAVTTALNISQEKFIVLNSADVLLGGVHLFFFLLFGIRWLAKFFPDYHYQSEVGRKGAPLDSSLFTAAQFFKLTGLSCLILGLTVGVSFLLFGKIVPIVVVIGVSTLGIAFSFSDRISKMSKTFDVGIYYILVFSLVAGSMTDINALFTFEYMTYLWLYTFLITFSTIFHLVLCKIFKIDRDTAIITSFAGICGPPFVGVVASAMNNREVVVAGVSCGLVGYAIGNYFGVLIYYMLVP